MSSSQPSAAEHAAQHLTVQVRFPAAPRPFVDPHADPLETIAHLQARVLSAFGLTETSGPGGQPLYLLYFADARLDDPNRTLGQIAGHAHELKLKLVQQLIQG